MLLLCDAINFFETDYKKVTVPYLVDVDVSASTKPVWVHDLHHDENKVYVGSGEQSFIQLMKQKELEYGKSMCLTPCYRDEEILDDLHYRMFLKLELINYTRFNKDKTRLQSVHSMLNHAMRFYKMYSDPYRAKLERVEVDEMQFDIYCNGIEIGSYGHRETPYGEFTYGTALALPRFQQALDRGQ